MRTITDELKVPISKKQTQSIGASRHILVLLMLMVCLVSAGILATPPLFALYLKQQSSIMTNLEQFPVTVDPINKLIVEDAQVNAFLESAKSPLTASVGSTENTLWNVFAWIATSLAEAPWYQSAAAVSGQMEGQFVTITPGMRKEQVAYAFAKALKWQSKQTQEFITAPKSAPLPHKEGSFAPGTYLLTRGMTPSQAQTLVNERFTKDILSHYGTTTQNIVPLTAALTIASLIERETLSKSDMRIVSGVIWNRLFANMNLQIDATLQYAKANVTTTGSWWPKVIPADMYRESQYNTYKHAGLPPTPIANPSVAAVLAALNPKKTSCLFYFNDTAGNIICTNTYAEHVTLLKQHYGRGK